MAPPRARALAVLLIFLFALIVHAVPASTAPISFAVSKTADTADGTCDADCSLREAVIAANVNPGADLIVVIPGVFVLDLVGADENDAATGDLDLLDDVEIMGTGVTKSIVDGNRTDRVFDIPASVTVTISDIAARHGQVTNVGGAGISNAGTVTLRRVNVTGNEDLGTETLSFGGGILNNGGTIDAFDSTIASNTANRGGGLFTNSGATLTRVTVSHNHAFVGAGIVNYGALTIATSTIAGNVASNNTGALLNADGSTTIMSSTIASNRSPISYPSMRLDAGTIEMRNTIVARNSHGNCDSSVISHGFNIEDKNTCGLTDPTDLPSTDPMLGVLSSNGGPTKTMPLLPESPAIDLGDTGCGRDQRGVPRPQGGSCDGGSYEFTLCLSQPVNVVGTPGEDTLFAGGGDDVILALGGDDVANGGTDNDRVCGGAGIDTLKGQAGDDILSGGIGADVCDGGPGTADKAYGCETISNIP